MSYIPATATCSPRACSIVWIAQRPPEPQTRVQIPAGPLFLAVPVTHHLSAVPRRVMLTSVASRVIRVATTVFSNRFLPGTIENATRHFVSHDVKRNVTEGKQSNFDSVARDRIYDEWEVRADRRSIRIDAAPIILAKKLTRLCFFERVRMATVLGVDERRAMLCNELLERQLKARAQARHVSRRQPDDIEITTARKRTISA